jgi:hypothetical protein
MESIGSADWRKIENAYGAPLAPNLRTDIARVTEAFLFFDKFEQTGEPLAKVKVILEAHDKAATRFFNELFGGTSAVSDAGVYAHQLIDNNFTASRLGGEAGGLDVFLDFLRAFHIACNASIKQLNDPLVDRKGNALKFWVSRLVEILADAKSVYKDRRSRSENPFVLLVLELQKYLPAEHQRDAVALADALSEVSEKNERLRDFRPQGLED